MKNILMVLSGKGGVGKSTVTTLLAATLARKGLKVGLLDVDLCGPSIPYLLGIENESVTSSTQGWIPVSPSHPSFSTLKVMSLALLLKSRDDAVVWRGPKKSSMIKQFLTQVVWGDLDYLVVDTPPGTSDEHLTLVEYVQGNFAHANFASVLVSTPQLVSVIDVQKEIAFCQSVGLRMDGLFENMSGYVCPTCAECTQIFGSGGGKKLCELTKIPYLGNLPLDPRLTNYIASGSSFFDVYLQYLENSPSTAAIQSFVAGLIAPNKQSSEQSGEAEESEKRKGDFGETAEENTSVKKLKL